jgi:hypothetical protein
MSSSHLSYVCVLKDDGKENRIREENIKEVYLRLVVDVVAATLDITIRMHMFFSFISFER